MSQFKSRIVHRARKPHPLHNTVSARRGYESKAATRINSPEVHRMMDLLNNRRLTTVIACAFGPADDDDQHGTLLLTLNELTGGQYMCPWIVAASDGWGDASFSAYVSLAEARAAYTRARDKHGLTEDSSIAV